MSDPEKTCDFCDKKGLLLMPVRYAIAPENLGAPGLLAPLPVADATQSVGRDGKPVQSKGQDVKAGQGVHYTTRLLRSGYLYVYHEASARLEGYWMTDDGYYMPIKPEIGASPEQKSLRPCGDKDHAELAGCIAIQNAAKAGVVWLGCSDVEWTKAVIEAHRGQSDEAKARRALHMRAFDVSAWAKANTLLAGQKSDPAKGGTAHAVRMSALSMTVSEYSPPRDSVVPDKVFFGAAKMSLHAKAGKTEAMLAMRERRSPTLEAAIVVLDDPVGMACDLASLMYKHQEHFLDTPTYPGQFGSGYGHYASSYRDLVELDGDIGEIEAADNEKVRMQGYDAAEAHAELMKLGAVEMQKMLKERIAEAGEEDFGVATLREVTQKAQAAVSNPQLQQPSAVRIEEDQQKSWKKYTDRLHPAHAKWKKHFKDEEEAFNENIIAPLAKMHLAWMQSNQLINKLECTHDANHIKSGDVYSEIIHRCIVGTTQIAACNALYAQWLKGDITDKRNLLMRALVLRQDSLITELASAPLVQDQVPWQKLMDLYAEKVKELLVPDASLEAAAKKAQEEEESAKRTYDALNKTYEAKVKDTEQAKKDAGEKLLPDSVANVLNQLGPSLTDLAIKYGSDVIETKLARWMVLKGMILRCPVGIVELKGTASDSIKILSALYVKNLEDAAQASGKPLSPAQIKQLTTYTERQVVANFRNGNLASFNAAAQKGEMKQRMVVVITEDISKRLVGITDPTEKVRHLAAHVKSFKDLKTYNLFRVGIAKTRLGTISEGVLMAIDAVFKNANWKLLLSAEARAMSYEKTFSQDVRVRFGGALYVGAYAYGLAHAVKAAAMWRSMYATGMSERRTLEQVIKGSATASRYIGVVSAGLSGVVAAMDWVDAYDSAMQDKYGLMGLQILSGGTGMLAAGIAGYAVWTGTTASLTLLGVTLSLVWWAVLLVIVVAGIGLLIEKIKGDKLEQWLGRSYWGVLPAKSRYRAQDKKNQAADFKLAMAGD